MDNIKEGDVFSYWFYDNETTKHLYQGTFRFVTAFDINGNVVEEKGSSNPSQTYTVPSGISKIIFSIPNNRLIDRGMVIYGIDKPEKYEAYFEPYYVLQGIVNAKEFTKGDGITDDTDGLKKALMKATGETLYIPNGTYLISEGLIIPSETKVIGEGEKTKIKLIKDYYVVNLTKILWRDTRYCYSIITTAEDSKNIIIKDISLECDKTDIRGDRIWGITAYKTQNFLINNCNVSYINYDGNIDQSNAGQPGFGVFIFHSNNCVIDKGKYEYCGYECIGGEYCEDVTVKNCYIGTAWRVPLQFHVGSHRIKILNNTIKSVDCLKTHSLLTLHGRQDNGYSDCITDVLIEGNYFEGITDNSLPLRGGIQTVQGNEENIKIIGNTFKCSNICIANASDLQEGDYVKGGWIIEDNYFEGKKGIVLSHTDYVTCQNNTFKTTDEDFSITCEHKTIVNNISDK